jgi:hypothetical protein
MQNRRGAEKRGGADGVGAGFARSSCFSMYFFKNSIARVSSGAQSRLRELNWDFDELGSTKLAEVSRVAASAVLFLLIENRGMESGGGGTRA